MDEPASVPIGQRMTGSRPRHSPFQIEALLRMDSRLQTLTAMRRECLMFNSLKCVKKLEEAGVSREQAETHVQIMSELMESNLVTGEQFKEGLLVSRSELKEGLSNLRMDFKEDMATFRAEVKEDMATLRDEVKEDMNSLRTEFHDMKHEMRELENRMTIKLGTLISIAMGVLVAIIKLT
jgi:hypothetical protein